MCISSLIKASDSITKNKVSFIYSVITIIAYYVTIRSHSTVQTHACAYTLVTQQTVRIYNPSGTGA